MTLMPGTKLARIAQRPVESNIVRLAFLLIPVAHLPFAVAGGRAGGLAWLSLLAVASLIVVVRPMPVTGLRNILPYLAYLAYGLLSLVWSPDLTFGVQTLMQQAVVAVVYLLAWRAFEDRNLLPWVAKASSWWLIGGVGLAFISITTPFSVPGPRALSISLTAMFAVTNTIQRSRTSAWTLGVLGIAACAALGSRMAALTFIIFFLTTPNLGVARWMRYMLAAAMIPLLAWAVNTAAFQERFFHEQGGNLYDILTLSSNVDTSGRLDNWAVLTETCDDASVIGHGTAASRPLTLAASGGTASHPHNEFLRLYCDTGWIGSLLHWSFFVFVGVRAYGAASRTYKLNGGVDRIAIITMTLLAGFLLFSLTDNVLLYTQNYMAPLAVVLGLSDRAATVRTRREGLTYARTTRHPNVI